MYNTGTYMRAMKKRNDKFDGMFNGKQRRDLEDETDLPVYTLTKQEKEQAEKIRKTGCSSNMMHSISYGRR